MTKEPTPDQTIEMLQRERDSLLDTVEGLRWMVDQMNKDSEAMVYDMETHGSVYAAVAYTFGPRCDDYDPGCPGCSAWAEHDEITSLSADNERLRAALDGAYNERNRLVAFMARLFPSGLKKTAIEGWDEAWHGCVYINLPTGQASWHYHDREAHLFDGLPPYSGEWDGHSTDQKYERIARAAIEEAPQGRISEAAAQPAPSGWRPIETAPRDGSRVLLAYRTSLGKWRRVIAFYASKFAVEQNDYNSDWCDYDEAGDRYFLPEGWYECIENWDDYSSVHMSGVEPTHWTPLPPAPGKEEA